MKVIVRTLSLVALASLVGCAQQGGSEWTEQQCREAFDLTKCTECPDGGGGIATPPGPIIILQPGGGGTNQWTIDGEVATDSETTIDPSNRATCLLRDDFIGVKSHVFQFTVGGNQFDADKIRIENADWILEIFETELSGNWSIFDWYLTEKSTNDYCLLRPTPAPSDPDVPTPLIELLSFTAFVANGSETAEGMTIQAIVP